MNKDFIDEQRIEKLLLTEVPSAGQVEDIIQKALLIKMLSLEETALLLQVEDPALIAKMEEAAGQIKKKVYDNRIVTFAPLYLANKCINDCVYCGFRRSNQLSERRVLNKEEIIEEIRVLAGRLGHKRLIVVAGEHPQTGAEYIADALHAIYSVKCPVKNGYGSIRRANVNAAPMSVEELKLLHAAGIGTFQVFQETYHKQTYAKVHPQGTRKGDYQNRLYCMHRAMEAGVDDVGIGALFGLYDWKFEVLGLLSHAYELEEKFGIGPHTVSFPRLEFAQNTPFIEKTPYSVSDSELRRAVVVLRLCIPYAGMILTAREPAHVRDSLLPLGITQVDASSNIAIGGYSAANLGDKNRRQFELSDNRSLEEMILNMAQMGYITSFCTAGYRCGRTGRCIMDLLRSGKEGQFCKLNALLTFKEWLDDFAAASTKKACEPILKQEMCEVKEKLPAFFERFMQAYCRIEKGERDIYF